MTGHSYNYVTMFKKLGIEEYQRTSYKNTIKWMMSYADITYRDGNTGDMYFLIILN
jgi:hypothetical protein